MDRQDHPTRAKAFTLIELLIVIAIIGILSSVVLVSLSSARAKAKDSATMAEVKQFSQLLQRQFSDTGSFIVLQSGWDNSTGECNNSFASAGAYQADARRICIAIVNRVAGTNRFYTGNQGNQPTRYSIMAKLSNDTYYCMGSSGRISTNVASGAWTQPGCANNP